jgi:hypothetical protein
MFPISYHRLLLFLEMRFWDFCVFLHPRNAMKQITTVLQHASQLYNDSPFMLVLSVAVLLPLGFWSYKVLYPTYDPREPPPLWPKVPFIGHAYSIFREGGGYFGRL